MNLLKGYVYVDETDTKGNEVVFKWTSVMDRDLADPKSARKICAILHPIGEPDMQSCYGVPLDKLRGPIRKATTEDRGC